MRDLPETLEKIIPLIPAGDVTLIAKLESIKQSALFAAPEMQATWWKRCEDILNFLLPVGTELKAQIMEIFNMNKNTKAFIISDDDGGEICEIIFTDSTESAEQVKLAIAEKFCIDADSLELRRDESLDQYAPGPVTYDILLEHGWWFTCSECEHRVDQEGCWSCVEDDDDLFSEPPEPIATKNHVFCSAACQQAYEYDAEQIKLSQAKALTEFQQRYPKLTKSWTMNGGSGACKSDCYAKNKYNVVIHFRFDGAKMENSYCAGCMSFFIWPGDVDAMKIILAQQEKTLLKVK